MKKILALVLALMLVFSTSMVAFAATVNNGEGDSTGNVDVEIKSNGITSDLNDVDSDEATYSVDIDLKDYTFTYTLGAYNTSTHAYNTGDWDETTASVTVKNHSNTSLDVSAKFAATSTITSEKSGATATLDKASDTVDSAVGTENTDATTPNKTFTVTISGAPTVLDNYNLDTLTLTIAGTDA